MMNDPKSFAYWLQGYAELCGERPTEEQWAMIKEHLQLVFTKVTSTPTSPGLAEQPTYCASLSERGVLPWKPNWPATGDQISLAQFVTSHSC